MNARISRRRFLQRLVTGALVVDFDPTQRRWVTGATAATSLATLPPLTGALHSLAAEPSGTARRTPLAVLRPGSIDDVVQMVRFARAHHLKVGLRSQDLASQDQASGVLIDMSTLATIDPVGLDRVTADAGVAWRALLDATLQHRLTPLVLTDSLDLSLGDTLAVGGVGGATHRYGLQADNVLELQVVTGAGELVQCSRFQKPDLFRAALAGLGQCGIITRATIRLTPAPALARVARLSFPSLTTLLEAQRQLIDAGQLDHVGGQILADASANGRYQLEAAQFYTPPTQPDMADLLANLPGAPTATIDDMPYLSFLDRLTPALTALRSSQAPAQAAPRLDLFVPASQAATYLGTLEHSGALSSAGPLPVMLYSFATKRCHQPLCRLPDEPVAFLVSAQQGTLSAEAALRLTENHRALGGTRHPVEMPAAGQADWRAHFGPLWGWFSQAKHRYDPDLVLGAGASMF